MGDRKTPVELTNVCVICDGSRLLVEEKAGCGICFPGGHVEPGESMQQAVIREMREETGLTIEHPRLCGVKDWEEDDGSRYLALVPAGSGDDEAEDLEVSILKSVEENGEEFLEAIEDDAELEAVYSALMDLIYEDEEEPEA